MVEGGILPDFRATGFTRRLEVHDPGQVLAYVCGRRKDSVFLRLQELLEPFGITKYYTDGWGAYERHIDAEKHQVGKPTVSPLLIPLVYCYINGFQRAFSVEKPWPGGEKRMAGWAAHPVEW